jgi:hypothetical protein
MDRELWTLVLATVRRAAADVGWNGGRRAPRYPNWLIVAMYLWSVWHDRTLSWACDRAHYGNLFRPRALPSVSQFTRRVKSDDCRRVLQRVHDALAQRGLTIDEGYLDGKALPVSPVSKDRQATRGRVSGGFAKGYKLHAFVNEHRRVVAWAVTGLHADEKTVARVTCCRTCRRWRPGRWCSRTATTTRPRCTRTRRSWCPRRRWSARCGARTTSAPAGGTTR